jgi:hypothetical protein
MSDVPRRKDIEGPSSRFQAAVSAKLPCLPSYRVRGAVDHQVAVAESIDPRPGRPAPTAMRHLTSSPHLPGCVREAPQEWMGRQAVSNSRRRCPPRQQFHHNGAMQARARSGPSAHRSAIGLGALAASIRFTARITVTAGMTPCTRTAFWTKISHEETLHIDSSLPSDGIGVCWIIRS